MLDTFPGSIGADVVQLASAIDELVDCANACTQCADACMAEPEHAELIRCIRRNLDCADICQVTARVVARQAEYDGDVTRTTLEACIAACRACGDECASHAAHMRHCEICAERCRRCEKSCRDLLESIA
jgi:hypothetical protein